VIDEISQLQGQARSPAAQLSERLSQSRSSWATTTSPVGDSRSRRRCAPPTASDHLQKAEATIVRGAVSEFGIDA
jgi:hypothetical protein